MDPALGAILNIASLVLVGWFFVMVLQHISRSQKHMEAQGEATDLDVRTLRNDLETAVNTADRLRTRIEALETIVTSDGFDLDREVRAAGLDLDVLGEPPTRPPAPARRRTHA